MSIVRTAVHTRCALGALAIAAIACSEHAAPPPDDCRAPATRIHAIQGTGRSSPMLGREDVTVDAVVVGVFPGLPEGLGGFFVQEEDAETDADPRTSEGLFVFDGGLGAAVSQGDRVRVRGRVIEFFGLTELTSVTAVERCPPRGRASAVRIRLPLDDVSQWEQWEGMRVVVEQPLVATGQYDLGRYGAIELAAGARLWQATQRAWPGAEAAALARQNERGRLLLDDGSEAVDPRPVPYLRREDGGTLRLGDTLSGVEGVVDFSFGRFRIQPTVPVRFEPGEARPATPPEVGGTLRFVAWNVANHMNGDGRGGGFPTRGPRSPEELERQRAKLVSTLIALDPDVAALAELENDGAGPDGALARLLDALDASVPGSPWAAVDPGQPRLGTQPIAVGIIYRSDAVAPIGRAAILDDRSHPDFDAARNRPSLAQTFESLATGEPLTVVANHFKSKGSSCDAAGDPDLGDGQGRCNLTRERAARALVEWLATDPTQASGAPVLIAGDLNAYPREDPIGALEDAGYVDLVAWFAGSGEHSYVFDGHAGRLDHAFAHADLLPFVTGARVWHTNADESRLLDYRADNPMDLYAPDPFRASDHDPVLVGLFPEEAP